MAVTQPKHPSTTGQATKCAINRVSIAIKFSFTYLCYGDIPVCIFKACGGNIECNQVLNKQSASHTLPNGRGLTLHSLGVCYERNFGDTNSRASYDSALD